MKNCNYFHIFAPTKGVYRLFAEQRAMHIFFVTIITAVTILLMVILAMSFKVLFFKNGRFPDGHACKHDYTKQKISAPDSYNNNLT